MTYTNRKDSERGNLKSKSKRSVFPLFLPRPPPPSQRSMVFHGSRLVFNGLRTVFMVFHGSRLAFMVPGRFSWYFMVFHGSWSVFMVTG